MRSLKVILFTISFFVAGIGHAQIKTSMLLYKVWEQDVDPYDSRILITDDFVRLDDAGLSTNDYTLYDRKLRVIYNVTGDDENIFVMNPLPSASDVPDSLKLSLHKEPDLNAPKIAGKVPEHIFFLTNEKVCREVTAINGLLVGEMKAIIEFQQTLGLVQRRTVDSIPKEMQSNCMLSDIVYRPERGFEHGLVISEKMNNKRQLLMDFKTDFEIDKALFSLPEDYKRIDMSLL